MKRRLTLITEIIAPYRIPVFNALAARDDLDLHVIFLSETDPHLREWQVYKNEIRFSYQVLPSFRRRLGRYNVLINRGAPPPSLNLALTHVLCGGYNYLASWQAQRWAAQAIDSVSALARKYGRRSAPPHIARRIVEAPFRGAMPGLRRSRQSIASVSPPIRRARRVDLSRSQRRR